MKWLIKYIDGSEKFVNSKENLVKELNDNYGEIRSIEEVETNEVTKLIELLNEYETPRSWVVYKSYDDYDWFFYWVDCDWETEIAWSDSLICSKKFWWIEWLVENEKIEYKNLNKIHARKWLNVLIEQELYEDLIMLLSIQDRPIVFLISILKNV